MPCFVCQDITEFSFSNLGGIATQMSTLGSLVLSFLKRHTVQIKTKMRMIFKIIFTGLPKAPKKLTLLTTKTLPSK